MALNWKKWTKNDAVFGILVPTVVVLFIVGLSQIPSIVGYESESGGLAIGLTMEILELTVIVAVPLMLGLLWNQWAGGSSGFLMGTLYAMYWANSFHGATGSGTILLAYIVSPMLIGYMAGALNKRSEEFRRMAIAGVISTTIGGIVLFGVFQLSPANVVTGTTGVLLNILPRIACGVIIAALAKVFFWYGMTKQK